MELTIIAAVSENNVIGVEGKIPWKISEDMKRFKNLTTGHPVIMGRKTYQSIPSAFRPLPERKNIVLSRTLELEKGIHVARTIEEALDLTENKNSYVIGGERVYQEFLPLSDRMELTRVHAEYEGDTFFPKVDWDEWNLVNEERHQNGITGLEYSFLTYVRK